MQPQVVADGGAADPRAQQQRRRLDRAAGDDDDRRPDGERVAQRAVGRGDASGSLQQRLDAGGAAALDDHPLDGAPTRISAPAFWASTRYVFAVELFEPDWSPKPM